MALSRKTPMKRSQISLKRGKDLQAKKKTVEQIQKQRAGRDRMWELFEEHWKQATLIDNWHACENCGIPIWGENRSLYHHHLLEKGIDRYKHLMYEIDNLMLICSTCHTQVTNGYPGEAVIKATEKAHKQFGV